MRKKIKKSNVFSSFCRLCLAMSDNLIDITSEEFDFDIIDLVFETLDIKFVKQNSVYSNQFVCVECLEISQFIKKFKQGCKQSLEILTKCVIREMPKGVADICWTGDRKRLKELMTEVNQVHEESLVVQVDHYKELYSSSLEGKAQLKPETTETGEIVETNEKTNIAEKESIEGVEIKNEIKEEDVEVNVEGYDFDDGTYTDDDNEKSIHESDGDHPDTLIEDSEEVQVTDRPKRKKNYKNYQCEICLKFFDGYDFKYHMNTHLKIFPFRCAVDGCDRKFTSPGNLSAHKKSTHEKAVKIEVKQENLIPCDRCGLAYTRKQLYNHFKRDHGKITWFVFRIVLKMFKYSQLINNTNVRSPIAGKSLPIFFVSGNTTNESIRGHLSKNTPANSVERPFGRRG